MTLDLARTDLPISDIFERRESQVRSYSRLWPVTFERAAGASMYAESGNEYIDFFMGAGALNYGHNNPLLKRSLIEYIQSDGVMHSLDMQTTAKRRFLEAFENYILRPRSLDYRVQFTGPTGTNSVEAALKLARKVTGRTEVVSFANAFHGMTLGSLAVTANRKKRAGAGVVLPHAHMGPYDQSDGPIDLDWLEREWVGNVPGTEKAAAVIVETVQGEGGLAAARDEWLRRLSNLCADHEVLLIVDDVQAGCGRIGSFFSFEAAGIIPDIVCLSKSLSGYGLPLALTLFRPDLDVWDPGEHNGTFRGNNPAFVTGAAALHHYWGDEHFQDQVTRLACSVRERLTEISLLVPGASLCGRGLLSGSGFRS